MLKTIKGMKVEFFEEIREFTCKKCNTFILRDVNSAINIAKKDGHIPLSPSLSEINRVGTYILKQRRLVVI